MRGYDTAEYAKTRLVETVIMWNGKPTLVLDVNKGLTGNILITHQPVEEANQVLSHPLEEFDINPVPLGYVNHKYNSVYIMRAPMRRDWRQGLRIVSVVTPSGECPRGIPYHTIAHTILNKFPKFSSCLEKMKKNSGTAFHRDFSLRSDRIEYKGMFEIGKVDADNGNVLINEDSYWLTEAFNEAMEFAA